MKPPFPNPLRRAESPSSALEKRLPVAGAFPVSQQPRFLEQIRLRLRAHHYSGRTVDAYVEWIRRFILYHGKKHPRELGEAEVVRYLSSLATERHVSSSTQNQALSALLFLYGKVIGKDLAW